MTEQEITNMLSTEFDDEIKGVKFYRGLSDNALAMGNIRDAEIFEIIAKEEYSHAKFIKQYLIAHEKMLSDAQGKSWVEVFKLMN